MKLWEQDRRLIDQRWAIAHFHGAAMNGSQQNIEDFLTTATEAEKDRIRALRDFNAF